MILIPYKRTCIEVLAALQVRALLVLAGVILIPYERTCIEVLAGACCITGLACWCLLHYRPCLLVLACVILIPYERTCIEVLAGACCITGSCLAGACWCGTDTLRTHLYRSACWCLLHYRPCLLVLAALQVRALLVLACVILIPYERICIEVLAGAWLRFFGFWVSILL